MIPSKCLCQLHILSVRCQVVPFFRLLFSLEISHLVNSLKIVNINSDYRYLLKLLASGNSYIGCLKSVCKFNVVGNGSAKKSMALWHYSLSFLTFTYRSHFCSEW